MRMNINKLMLMLMKKDPVVLILLLLVGLFLIDTEAFQSQSSIVVSRSKEILSSYNSRSRRSYNGNENGSGNNHISTAASPSTVTTSTVRVRVQKHKNKKQHSTRSNNEALPKNDRLLLSAIRKQMKSYMRDNNKRDKTKREELLESLSTMTRIIVQRSEGSRYHYDVRMVSSLFYECLYYTWYLNGTVSRNVLSSFMVLLLSCSHKYSNSNNNNNISSSTATSSSLLYLCIQHDKFTMKEIPYDKLLYQSIQRCVTLKGITPFTTTNTMPSSSTLSPKQLEYEWNQILHALIHQYPNLSLAKQLFQLQAYELSSSYRLINIPPLTPITYSIVIKGCIKHGNSIDIEYVDYLYKHAQDNPNLTIDTIMYNTLLDAYVTLHPTNLQKALHLLQHMEQLPPATTTPPDVRSYNTILKGYAKFNYSLSDATTLVHRMEQHTNNNILLLRDDVTVNTLVSIAISNELFHEAEDILSRWFYFTTTTKQQQQQQQRRNRNDHPNIQAYTDLIDGYIKNNQLQNALDIFYIMQTERFINPNEYTLTVLVNGLGKIGKVNAIWKLLDYCRFELKIKPSCIFYNAIFSGLLSYIGTAYNTDDNSMNWSIMEQQKLDQILTTTTISNHDTSTTHDTSSFNKGEEEATPPQNKKTYILQQIKQFYNFMLYYTKTTPNETTIQLILTTISRTNELQSLSKYIPHKHLHPLSNIKIATTLLQGYIYQENYLARDSFFDSLQKKQLIDSFVLNTYLDSLLPSSKGKIPEKDCMKRAFSLFQTYSAIDKRTKHKSDTLKHVNVMTFTILISAFFKLEKDIAFEKGWKLYDCMKKDYHVHPDVIMLNVIFSIMIQSQNDTNYYTSSKRHFQFLQVILDDTSTLLTTEEYKQRKVLMHKLLFRSLKPSDKKKHQNDLFENKGWNRMDSNFPSLFGDKRHYYDDQAKNKKGDSFLERKGWNDVDSGFRII